MKAILSFVTILLLLCSIVANAQQFSPTTGVRCANCVPTNYNAIGTPFISDVNRPGLNVNSPNYFWDIYESLADTPPSVYSQQLPAGQGQNSFVTLKTSEGALNDKLYLDVSGFDVNKTYVFRYSVCALGMYDYPGPVSPYAQSATMDIITVGQNPDFIIASQTTNFDVNNRKHWTSRNITFTASSSTLRFRLSGKTPGQAPGYVHFSIDKYPFDCDLTPKQVELTKTFVETPFKAGKLDLATVPIKSTAPAGAELVWKAGANSTDPTLTTQQASGVGISNQNPPTLQPYYAFYYVKDLNCYYSSVSQAELKFMYVPKQVTVKQTNVTVACNQLTDLTALIDNPLGSVLWYTNNTHSGLAVSNPTAVPPGDYYAFYFDNVSKSYSLPNGEVSIAQVHVVNPLMPGTPDLGPTMDINSLIFPVNGSKDFVVNIYNSAGNSNCSVFFKILKLPGFTITYNTQAGTSNVNGGVLNNNDLWTFSEDVNFITITAKDQISANGYSVIGFKITRKANTPANSAQNITVTIPQLGGGGEINTANNALINTVTGI
nr:hypothetical protein [uncultured Dyadobacter sp.]